MHRKHRKRMIPAILPGVLCALSLTALEAQANDALVNARQKFFGIENVDANGNVKGDKVIVSWASNTTYVVSIMGQVIMLDSFIRNVQLPTTPVDRRYSKMLPQDFVDLKPEMVDARLVAARRDREIDARILDHPLRVVAFFDGRRRAENRRVETNALRQIVDRNVDVKAFHAGILLRRVEDFFGAHTGPQRSGCPRQQFSVRYATRPFIAAKLAV